MTRILDLIFDEINRLNDIILIFKILFGEIIVSDIKEMYFSLSIK